MPQDKTIKVQDNRKTNIVTGLPLGDKYRKHAEIPQDIVEMVIESARKHGVDPGTALAIGLQETNFRPDSMTNPFMLGNYNPYGNIIDESMKFMSEKNKVAKQLGKTTEEDVIQAYNGYGKLKGAGKMYGIDTAKMPIDMNTDPLYGKTVKQLRDSVILQNPEILKLINMGNKSSIPKLKCGGKKMKKMATGGINKVPTMQSSQLATKFAQANNLPQKALSENGLVKSTLAGSNGAVGAGVGGDAIMAGANLLSDTVTGTLETRKKDYTDNRINPESTMRQNASLDVAGDITKSTLSGAAAGTAIMPGIGTAIGAGVGLVTSGVKNILGSKKRKAERAKAKDEWSDNWLNSSVQGLSTRSYKDGGNKDNKPDYSGMGIGFMENKPNTVSKDFVYPNRQDYIGGTVPATGIRNPIKTAKTLLSITESGKDFNTAKKYFDILKANLGRSPKTNEIRKFSKGIDDYYQTMSGTDGFATKGITAEEWAVQKATGNFSEDVGRHMASGRPKYNPKASGRWNKYPSSGRGTKNDLPFANGGMVLTTRMPVSMAQGGEITGAGGPKEDKITKKIEDGSFIIPAENGDKALEIGRQYLGWEDGEQANRSYPGSEVKVSDGEVLFTPEEVGILSYNGIDLNPLAPNANDKLGKGMATGGYKYNNATGTYEWDETADGNDPGYETEQQAGQGTAPAAKSAQTTTSTTKGSTPPVENKSPLEMLADYIPEAAGAIQIGAAIAGSRKAGAMPDVNVSQYLKELSTEQRKDAQYGLEPGAKSAMLSSIERDKRNTNNAIVNRGGTAGEVMSNLQSTLSTGIDKSLSIEMADAAEKTKKKAIYAGTVGAMAGQDFDSKKVALENWMQWQDVNAGLLNAGISNIVGVRKLRAELDAMKKIGNNRVDVKSMIPK